MFKFALNEATAARRRIFFYAVSATDGYTAVTTGLTSASVYIVQNGAIPGSSPVSPTFTHIDSGLWYYEMGGTAVNTVGVLTVRISDAAIRTVHLIGYVYNGDPLAAIPSFPTNFNNLAITVGGAVTVGSYASGAAPLQPTVAGRTLDVTTTGEAGIDWANIGSPTTAVAFTGTTISTSQQIASVSGSVNSVTTRVTANTDQWNGTGVTGMPMPTYTQPTGFLSASFPTGTIANTTNITAGTITTVSGNVTGSVGSVTGNVNGNVVGSVGSVTGNVNGNVVGSVGSVSDPASIWNRLTSNLTTVGSVGKLLVDNVNATISSRSTLTAADVWNALTSGFATVGSVGKLLVDNINATISSRSTLSATDVWSATTRTLSSGTNIVLTKGTGITGFNDITAADVWANGTRTLSAGTNIVLAKGTGITGFNDLSSTNVADAVWNAVVQTYDVTSSNTTGTFGKALIRSDQSSKNGDVSMYSISGTNGIDVDIHRIDNDATAAINLKTLLMNTGTITLGGQFDTTGNTAITKSVWNQLRSTASPTNTVPASGTFGFYLDQQVSAGGGGGGGSLTAADVWDFDISGYPPGVTAGYACYQGFVESSLGKEFAEQCTTPAHLESQADYILNRNIAGGGNGTGATTDRTVRSALRSLRNRSQVTSGTLTVYAENDATAAWTASVSQDPAAVPITGIDPA